MPLSTVRIFACSFMLTFAQTEGVSWGIQSIVRPYIGDKFTHNQDSMKILTSYSTGTNDSTHKPEIRFILHSTSKGIICGQLFCSVNFNKTHHQTQSVYDLIIYELRDIHMLKRASVSLSVSSTEVKTSMTGDVSINIRNLTVALTDDRDCMFQAFVCRLEAVDLRGKSHVIVEKAVPNTKSGTGKSVVNDFDPYYIERELRFINRSIDLMFLENKLFKRLLNGLLTDNTFVNRTLTDLLSEKTSMKRIMTDLLTENTSMNTTLTDLKTEKTSLNRTLTFLIYENTSNNRTLNDLIEEYTSTNRTMNDLIIDNTSMNKTLTDLKTETTFSNRTLSDLMNDNIFTNVTLTDLITETTSINKILTDLISDNMFTNITLSDIIVENTSINSTLIEIISANTFTNTTLTDLRDENTSMKRTLTELTIVNTSSNKTLTDLISESRSTQQTMTDLKEENTFFNKTLTDLITVNTSTNRTLTYLISDNTSTNKTLTNLITENTSMSKLLTELITQNTLWNKTLTELRAQNDATEQKLDKINELNTDLGTKLDNILFQMSKALDSSSNDDSQRTDIENTCQRGMINTEPRLKITLWDKVNAVCDAESDGGGWVIIQMRSRAAYADFITTRREFMNGFQTSDASYWLGFDNIHNLTLHGYNELRIDVVYNAKKHHALYSNFHVYEETSFYVSVDKYIRKTKDGLHESTDQSIYTSYNDGTAQPVQDAMWKNVGYGNKFLISYSDPGTDTIERIFLTRSATLELIEMKVRKV